MYRSCCILTFKFIIRFWTQLNLSIRMAYLYCWFLTSRNVSPTFFLLVPSGIISSAFLRSLKLLIELATPYLTCYHLWKHQGCIFGCTLSWIIIARNCLPVFEYLNTVSVACFLLSTFKYIRVACFFSELKNQKIQYARFLKITKEHEYNLCVICSPLSISVKLIFLEQALSIHHSHVACSFITFRYVCNIDFEV